MLYCCQTEGSLEKIFENSIFQIESILRALERGGKIEDLNLSLNQIYGEVNVRIAVQTQVTLLACRVIPCCRIVKLRLVNFISWQQLFMALSTTTPSSLEELDISKNNLSAEATPANIEALAEAVVRILRVKLMETKLKASQTAAIFKRICQEGGRIEDLDIMFNNLSQLDPDHLAKAATRLVKLNIGWTKLNERQLRRLFERLDSTKNNLRELKLSGLDLSRLDSRLLVRVVSRLEVVDLNFTRLGEDQVAELLHRLEENHHLKDLTLSSNDLSKVENVQTKLQKLFYLQSIFA